MHQPSQITIQYLWMNAWKPVPSIAKFTLEYSYKITFYTNSVVWGYKKGGHYVDDVVSDNNTIEEVEVVKQRSSLQSSNTKSESELTCTKEKFKNTANITKILAVPCKKNRDNLSVVVTKFNEKLMPRRNVLKYIASIYGPLGLISASHIIGKVIYRKLCNKKLPWDREISQILKKKFKTMCHDITNILTEIPRSILTNKESIT